MLKKKVLLKKTINYKMFKLTPVHFGFSGEIIVSVFVFRIQHQQCVLLRFGYNRSWKGLRICIYFDLFESNNRIRKQISQDTGFFLYKWQCIIS